MRADERPAAEATSGDKTRAFGSNERRLCETIRYVDALFNERTPICRQTNRG